jgi:putative nucleotidyltransferase with HDIG domain
MAINYKKELEAAAKSMILVHEPELLIRMIVRMMVQKVKIKHAGILLHDKERDTYVLKVSRGPLGLKVPKGFARMDSDNPLVRFFRERKDKQLFNDGAVVYEKAKKALSKRISRDARQLLKGLLYQMEIFQVVVCIPSYFRDELLGVLLMGAKKGGRTFSREELDFFIALTSDVAMAIRNAQLFKEIELELDKKHRLFIHTTIALATAIDAKDHYTHGHTARVTNLSVELAKRLMQKNKKGFNEKRLESLQIAALLHDIGKIGIPESILNKQGALDEAERKRMQEHSNVGVTIIQPIKELEEAILGVKYHHERYDGSGYPEGLKGDNIPLIAAIISIADTFDAMITDRPYRRGLSKEQAINEIQNLKGRQFHPELADLFVGLYKEGKI